MEQVMRVEGLSSHPASGKARDFMVKVRMQDQTQRMAACYLRSNARQNALVRGWNSGRTCSGAGPNSASH
jgi:hypothetical protein